MRAARALPGDRDGPGSPPATPPALPANQIRCFADHHSMVALGIPNWAIDRDVWDLTAFYTPVTLMIGRLKEPRLAALGIIVGDYFSFIMPPEVIEQYGDVQDWRNLVGTGPFMLTDVVEGSSMTYVKNPDYWGYDEKYPQNRLPYVDELRVLVMPEEATVMSALRSGQLDFHFLINNLDAVQSHGEGGDWAAGEIWTTHSRLWIDSALKKEMGH